MLGVDKRRRWPKADYALIRRLTSQIQMLWAWPILGLCAIATGLLAITNIYPFLAVHRPLPAADALVVEGWLPDQALDGAIAEFKRGNYRTIIITSCPILHGYYLGDYQDFADLKAATIIKMGVPSNEVVSLAVPGVKQHRTTEAALTLRQWLVDQTEEPIQAVNVYTIGPHARRTWRLYQRVIPPTVSVGIIAALPRDFDPSRWWHSSAGARSVISETVGFLYAVLLKQTV